MGTTTFDRIGSHTLAPIANRRPRPVASGVNPSATKRATRGVELLTIAVIIAVGTVIMTGALAPAQEWNARQSAIDATGLYIYRARAVAVRSSRNTWLVRNGSVLAVYIDSAGTPTRVGDPIDLRERYGVNLWTTQDTLAFDPRGFIRSTGPVFILTSKHGADTVCVPDGRNANTAGCP